VVADHSVLAHDEPVRRLFLDPVLPVVFSVHHVTALPGFHRLRRARGCGGCGRRGGGRSGSEAGDGDVGDGDVVDAAIGGAAGVVTLGHRDS